MPPSGKIKKKSKNPCGRCPGSSTGCDLCLQLKEHAERHALKCMLSYAERNEVRPGLKYNFADLADEEGGTPWPEIEELMPMAIAAVKSAFDSCKEELKNLDNAKKKHVILPAVEAIVKATPAEELNKYRDLVLPRRAERIETKKKSK